MSEWLEIDRIPTVTEDWVSYHIRFMSHIIFTSCLGSYSYRLGDWDFASRLRTCYNIMMVLIAWNIVITLCSFQRMAHAISAFIVHLWIGVVNWIHVLDSSSHHSGDKYTATRSVLVDRDKGRSGSSCLPRQINMTKYSKGSKHTLLC